MHTLTNLHNWAVYSYSYFEALDVVAGLSEVNAERLVVVIEEHAEEVLDHQVGLDVPHRPEPRTGHANEDADPIPSEVK